MNEKDKKMMESVETPAYVVDKRLLRKNLELLKYVQDKTGCRILLALKGFSMFSVFPLVGEYLAGITSSSLNEAKLGADYMGKEVHIYAPAYRDDEFDEILETCEHIVFNSVEQYKKFRTGSRTIRRISNAGCESILSIRRWRRSSMIRVRSVQGLGRLPENSVRRTLRGSMDCIFIRCVNRMLTRWSAHLRLSRRSSGSIFTR